MIESGKLHEFASKFYQIGDIKCGTRCHTCVCSINNDILIVPLHDGAKALPDTTLNSLNTIHVSILMHFQRQFVREPIVKMLLGSYELLNTIYIAFLSLQDVPNASEATLKKQAK